MGDVLMLYASQTGNTENLTDMLETLLKELGQIVTVKSFDFDVIDVDSLEQYDAVLVGTYTWDDGELPYEVEDFYIDLEEADLTGQLFAVYGTGDSFYDTFGGAIELMYNQLKYLGASVVGDPLIIDLESNAADEKRMRHLVETVVDVIRKRDETVA